MICFLYRSICWNACQKPLRTQFSHGRRERNLLHSTPHLFLPVCCAITFSPSSSLAALSVSLRQTFSNRMVCAPLTAHLLRLVEALSGLMSALLFSSLLFGVGQPTQCRQAFTLSRNTLPGAVTTKMMKDDAGMILKMCIKCPAWVHYSQSGSEGFAGALFISFPWCLAGKVSVCFKRANL